MISSNKNIYMPPNLDLTSLRLFALTFICKLISAKLIFLNLLNAFLSEYLSNIATVITILVGLTTLVLNFNKIKRVNNENFSSCC